MSDPRDPRSRIELAIDRTMRKDRVSRRSFLRRAGRGGVALGAMATLPGLIAACSPGGGNGVTLDWVNWPAYIDLDEEGSPSPTPYPTINAFIEETGINVEYSEALLDNAEFMQQILPDLSNGNFTGWDLMTPGGWVIQRLADLDYLEPLDHSLLPNWTANAADWAVGNWYDPDNTHSVWWQGGITGIAFDPTQTGRDLATFDDLLDPEFAGRVGAFSDMRDMFGLTLLSLGISPEEATIDDVTAAQAKLLEANERGQFRGYYGNEYWDALAAGDLIASVAWSGDAGQITLNENENVRFVIPSDGGMRWNDNLAIPRGSTERIEAAHQLIDYWYSPEAATALSEYIGYFTGVAGISDRIQQNADAARESGDTETADYLDILAPQVEPTEDQLANTYQDKQLTEEEEAEWNALFEEVLGG
jgi:spermidine/putrescine transport system substrate-binding protein